MTIYSDYTNEELITEFGQLLSEEDFCELPFDVQKAKKLYAEMQNRIGDVSMNCPIQLLVLNETYKKLAIKLIKG